MRILLYANDSDFLFFIVGWTIAFIIGVLITRWIFGINTIIENLKKQTELSFIQIRILVRLAEKMGVSNEDINYVLKDANMNFKNEEDRKSDYHPNSEME